MWSPEPTSPGRINRSSLPGEQEQRGQTCTPPRALRRSVHHSILFVVPDENKGNETGLTGKGPGLVGGNSAEVAQVALVAHQHDDNVAVGVVPQLLQPSLHVLVGQVFGDVVDQQSAHGAAVVPAAAQGQRVQTGPARQLAPRVARPQAPLTLM